MARIKPSISANSKVKSPTDQRRVELKQWIKQWNAPSTASICKGPVTREKIQRLRLKHSHFQLFDLPLEIRNKIYGFVFVKDGPVKVDFHLNRRSSVHRAYMAKHRHTHNSFVPLLTNRQVYEEAKPIAYGKNIFEFPSILVLERFVLNRVSSLISHGLHKEGRGVQKIRSPLKLIRKVKLTLSDWDQNLPLSDVFMRRDIRSLLYPKGLNLENHCASVSSPGFIQDLLWHMPDLQNLQVSAWLYQKKQLLSSKAGEVDRLAYMLHNRLVDAQNRDIAKDPQAERTMIKFLYPNKHFQKRDRWIRFGSSGVKGKVDLFEYRELRKQLVSKILAKEFCELLLKKAGLR